MDYTYTHEKQGIDPHGSFDDGDSTVETLETGVVDADSNEHAMEEVDALLGLDGSGWDVEWTKQPCGSWLKYGHFEDSIETASMCLASMGYKIVGVDSSGNYRPSARSGGRIILTLARVDDIDLKSPLETSDWGKLFEEVNDNDKVKFDPIHKKLEVKMSPRELKQNVDRLKTLVAKVNERFTIMMTLAFEGRAEEERLQKEFEQELKEISFE